MQKLRRQCKNIITDGALPVLCVIASGGREMISLSAYLGYLLPLTRVLHIMIFIPKGKIKCGYCHIFFIRIQPLHTQTRVLFYLVWNLFVSNFLLALSCIKRKSSSRYYWCSTIFYLKKQNTQFVLKALLDIFEVSILPPFSLLHAQAFSNFNYLFDFHRYVSTPTVIRGSRSNGALYGTIAR